MRLEAEYSKKDLANYNLPRFGPPLLKTRLLSLLSTKKKKKKTKYVTLLGLELTLSKWNNMSSMQIIGPHTSCWSGMKN